MSQRESVETWLTQIGVEYQEVEASPPHRWVLETAMTPFGIFIAEHEADFPHLYMQINLRIADDHVAALRELSEDDRDRFMYDVRIELAASPVGYQVEMGEQGLPARIILGINLFEENLGRAGFLRRTSMLQSAGLTASLMAQKMARFRSWS